jgi:hypothetical protein
MSQFDWCTTQKFKKKRVLYGGSPQKQMKPSLDSIFINLKPEPTILSPAKLGTHPTRV